MTLDPTSGPIGTTIQITGTIDCPDQEVGSLVLLGFWDPNAGPQTTADIPDATLGEGGAFSGTATVPATMTALLVGVGYEEVPTPSEISVRAACSASESSSIPTIYAPFTVTDATTTTSSTTTSTTSTTTTAPAGGFSPPAQPPAGTTPLTNPPGTTAAGGTVNLDEGGFEPGEDVPVVLYSSPVVLTTATADGTGRVQVAVRIPANTAPGTHTIVLFGQSQVKSASITVQAAALPTTGSSTYLLVPLSVALLLLGAAAIGTSRRRLA